MGLAALCLAVCVAAAQPANDSTLRIERLAAEVERTESLRAVKHLQHAYAQYAQAGLWNEMAALFAEHAELVYGQQILRGRPAIARFLLERLGKGNQGLPAGGVHLKMIDRPVINLAADGATAKGRWLEFSLHGVRGGEAGWAGGIQTNDYVRERGIWKFARLHYHEQFSGSYEKGWTALERDIAVVPYHFTPDEAGTPIPALPPLDGEASRRLGATSAPRTLQALEHRLVALVERDQVLNLYNAWGYYLDRKMWDDATDLFTDDASLSIGSIGTYRGRAGIRRALEQDGPAGLRRGELNDHLLFNTIVEVAPGGTEARSRGLELRLEGDNTRGDASIAIYVNEARYRKQQGTWRIHEIRSHPAGRTDYYAGWAHSTLPEPTPDARHAPDEPAPSRASMLAFAPAADFFFPHPVTGARVRAPSGSRTVAAITFSAGARQLPRATSATDLLARLDEAERLLRVARAYDGVENISGAFGDWLDDFQWDKFSALFASDGRRRKYMLGFYTGPQRIHAAETLMYGEGPRAPRASVAIHHRLQRVIDVEPDGLAARFRTRLLNVGISERPGSLMAGMYPNDAAKLENGVWRFLNTSIDEPYWSTTTYADGWARAPEPARPAPGAPAPALSPMFARMLEQLPPDVPLSAMPNRQYGFVPGAIISWPDIKPMWFHYRNPVSGREPPYFCPDERTCEQDLARKASVASKPPIWKPVPLPPQARVTEGFVDSGGASLAYWDTGGKGEVIVLAHPASQSSLIWGYQQPYFAAAGYRVVAWSRRGFHNSTVGPPDDPGTSVGDLVALLDKLGIERAHLVGAAAGGITTMAFAIAHPSRTLSLTLAGSIVGPNEPEWSEMFGRLEMTEARRHLSAAFVELSASYRAGNPAGTRQFETISAAGRGAGAVSQPSGVTVDWKAMEALEIPVLLITGEADLYSPPSLQRLFLQHLRRAELQVVPESAHAVYWEQPEAFNRIVGEFLGRQ